ncbi:MAG: P-loop NTPase [Caldilineales bacterium]|nr:P-loop NTPase [Caldilineales bacterium]
MKHLVRLTLFSVEPDCNNAVARVCASNEWRLLLDVDHTHPLLWLQRQHLDAVLVDLDYPGALTLFAEVANCTRPIQFIAIARPERFAELHEAIQMGAAGFIAKPIDSEQLETTVSSAMAKIRAEGGASTDQGNRIISIVSLTGGVGKSTISVNLAAALQQQSPGVLLAELHGGPGVLAMMQNMRPHHDLSSLAQQRRTDAEVVNELLHPHSSGVRLLSAPTSLSRLVEFDSMQWRAILLALTETGMRTVVDTAPSADETLSEILNLSSIILVIARPEGPSIQNAVGLIELIRRNDGTTAQPRLILNRAKMPGALSEKLIRDKLGLDIFASIPDDPALASFALNRGVPFVLSHPNAPISERISRLAQSLIPAQANSDSAMSRRRESAEPKMGILQRLNPLTQS